MKVVVVMGSPRRNGNTAELCKPFVNELREQGAQVREIVLEDKTILPCKACYACQEVSGAYGCVQQDDMMGVVDDLLWGDCLVLATPIYSWYCPTKMKAMLDRYYGLNKYYGSASGCLWAGKKVAILATHGYDQAYATEPFERGIQRLCVHSHLDYAGLYSVRDTDNKASFQTSEAVEGARRFARTLLEIC